MIITRAWLNEWIDIENISTDKIYKTLNNIGLEVDSIKCDKIPPKVVVGKVIECKKHPNANKLSICQVNIGQEIKQIVCGAKNVATNQFVPVALIGATLGENFKIKETKLRGVESSGMICSAKEIGLPDINDGILVLDDSIGELIIGKELREYPLINDEVIEIELTANRGDCLNVRGVARDIGVGLDIDLRKFEPNIDQDQMGIARSVKITSNNISNTKLELGTITNEEIKLPLLFEYRIALVGLKSNNDYEKFAIYATHSTGVLFRLYSPKKLEKDEMDISLIEIENDAYGVPTLISNSPISKVGINQIEDFLPTKEDKTIIVEANYIDPTYLSIATKDLKITDSTHYYNATRGSNPDLEFGVKYLYHTIQTYSKSKAYTGFQQIFYEIPEKIIDVSFDKIKNLIGQEIDKSKIVNILQKLEFEVKTSGDDDSLFIKVPSFRHDIENFQDIVEEIVRIIGIDNINSSPINLKESNKIKNDSYINFKKREYYRKKSSRNGFFETLHYLFNSKKELKKYGFSTLKESDELTNPITNDLDTLRSTLILGLIKSASSNLNFGRKSIRLFEVGTVVDENRVESQKIAFIFSGDIERENISNNGKPKNIDFFSFARKISNIIGDFEIKNSQTPLKIVSPYESGEIIQKSQTIGYIARVHLEVENDFNLPPTYICEIDFDKLIYEDKKAKEYSKFPSLSRDLSILVPKEMEYAKIREFLKENCPSEVISFFPIDIYNSKELGDYFSLTIKFNIQSMQKTLEEEEINQIMDAILVNLEKSLGLNIR